jgi:hypothetical protein
MKLDPSIIKLLDAAANVASQETTPNWLRTVAESLESIAASVREEIAANNASQPPEQP